ncbi:MAG: ABC transporter substrate-binding protein [Emcibacter sp.]|nr:ABC transporter substrate-binding protein [Emcibacter sp.]
MALPSPAHASDIPEAKKPKIISLDYCADQYVLAVAEQGQIMALSMAADSAHSFFRGRAAGLPKFYSTVDELLYLKPDVVVQSWQAHAKMPELMQRRGIRLFETYFGSDPDVVIRNIRRAGQNFAQEKHAEALINTYKKRLAALRALPKLDLRAAYVTPSGYTAGSDTIMDDVIQLAGFQSYAAARKITGWQTLPMEDLLIDPPDIFIASFFDTNLKTQSVWSKARHGILARMLRDMPAIFLPGRYVSCNGLFMVDAAERLRAEAMEKGLIVQKPSHMLTIDQGTINE